MAVSAPLGSGPEIAEAALARYVVAALELVDLEPAAGDEGVPQRHCRSSARRQMRALSLSRVAVDSRQLSRVFSASTSKSATGQLRFMARRCSTRSWATAQLRYHLRSEGMTYHGAASVLQSSRAAA